MPSSLSLSRLPQGLCIATRGRQHELYKSRTLLPGAQPLLFTQDPTVWILGKAKRDMAELSHFVDLTHHLSPETLARQANPLKDLIRVALENPDLVTLANGYSFTLL